jgi:tetratricopeptide (TPR) repeat protein
MSRQFTITHNPGPGTPGPLVRGAFVAGVIGIAILVKACGDSKPRVQDIPQEQGTAIQAPITNTVQSPQPEISEPTITGPVAFSDGETAFREGRFDQATALFTAYTQEKPENVWGYYMLGLSQWKSGKLDDAVGTFDTALTRDSTHRKTLTNMARVLLELQRPEDALARGQQVVRLDSTNAEGWRIVGRAYADLDSTTQAITAYQRALVIDDTDVWSMNNLGMIYFEQQQYEQALRPLARAAELAPEKAVFQNNLGMALELSGQPTAAATAYRAAIAADTTYQKAITSLARVEGHAEATGVVLVDLAVISREFQNEIDKWKQQQAGVDVGVVKP